MACDRFHVVRSVGAVLAVLFGTPAIAQESYPHKLLPKRIALAWLRAGQSVAVNADSAGLLVKPDIACRQLDAEAPKPGVVSVTSGLVRAEIP
jgi:hypothetical protein